MASDAPAEVFPDGAENATSWGQPAEQNNVRALRRFNALLRGLASAGSWMLTLISAAAMVSFGVALFTINFENDIFSDGSTLTCILDGRTGEIGDAKR